MTNPAPIEADIDAALSAEFSNVTPIRNGVPMPKPINPAIDLSNFRASLRDCLEQAEKSLAELQDAEIASLEAGEEVFKSDRGDIQTYREKLQKALVNTDNREAILTESWQVKSAEIKAEYEERKAKCREAVAMAEAALGTGAKEIK